MSNREAWLNNLTAELAPAFDALAHPLPSNVRLACGFPSTGGRGKRIGECHYPAGPDGYTQIFIRPDQHKTLEVAAITLHELVHAALGPGHGHGKEFKKLATAHGLQGRMTSTEAGPKAIELLDPIIQRLGPYPQKPTAPIYAGRKQARNPHKNLNCPDCGFHAKVRLDQMSWGRLLCPVDQNMLLMKCEEAE